MPLYNIDRERVTYIPHHSHYMIWRDRLERAGQLQPMMDKLNDIVSGGEVHTSSWIPGDDWEKSGFQPIFVIAAQGVYEHAAFCFGLLLWEVMMRRDEDERWCFIKNENIRGMVYFRATW
ncbi:MAG: hypothetical protein JF616_02555 [Fibrobacteres bacterium]|nr:hypothetical protein [Fibrobacterota bacterium]